MIYDTLNNLPNYLGVSDNLDTVIEYIMARDITTLPAGRTRIDGDKAVVTVALSRPRPPTRHCSSATTITLRWRLTWTAVSCLR